MSVKIVAEIGINHNGDKNLLKQLVGVASVTHCDYVKLQKRCPDACVPEAQKGVMRDTPWGRMSYLDYKKRIELGDDEYGFMASHSPLPWFVSVWDIESVEWLARVGATPYVKIPSAKATDIDLLLAVAETHLPVILSTGMCDIRDVHSAVDALIPCDEMILMHSVSAYPLEDRDCNLRAMQALMDEFGYPVGYSDHTRGIHMAVAAVALGACMIEKHITIDRTIWGTDQAASLEPAGLEKMVRDIRAVEAGMGDGVVRVEECELEAKARLRG